MKYILITLLLIISLQSFSQEQYNNHLNSTLNDILLTQITNDLESHLPVIWVTTFGYVYANMTFYNDKMYFSDKEGYSDLSASIKDILINAISENIKFSLIRSDQIDSSLLIKSFSDERLLINLSYKNTPGRKVVTLESPTDKFSKVFTYQDGNLRSIITRKYNSYSMNSITYMGDSLKKNIFFSTKDRKYQIRTEKYSNGKILSIDYFKKSQEKDKLKIKKRETFYYDGEGILKKCYTSNRKGSIIDSTLFFYIKDLKQVVHYGIDGTKQVSYHFTNNGLSEKVIQTKDQKITLKYEYDQSGRLTELKMLDTDEYIDKKYEFKYNKEGELINFNIYNIDNESSKSTLESQYVFTFNDLGMVQTIRGMNRKGEIEKIITYDIQNIR